MDWRKARKEDATQIEKEEKKTFHEYAVNTTTFVPLLELFENGQWVLEDDGKIAAYFFTEQHNFNSLLPYNHETEGTHKKDGAYLYILMFNVTEPYRGKHIGTEMAKKLEQIGKEEHCDGVYLVLKRDSPKVDFWKKMGYLVIKDTVWSPIIGEKRECYVMAKSLC